MWHVLRDIIRNWPWTELMEQRTREVLYWICFLSALAVMLFGVWILWDRETCYRIIDAKIVALDTHCLSVTEAVQTPCPRDKRAAYAAGDRIVRVTDAAYRFVSPADGRSYDGRVRLEMPSWAQPARIGDAVPIRAHLFKPQRAVPASEPIPQFER